jgi:putative flavoprotein involved in K+ transport
MSEPFDVVVVGAGQAGLAASHELRTRGVPHVVLEQERVAQTWRGRWDSFCLVTPNWSVQLPGRPYDGDDPDGFMPRDEVVVHLERYAEAFAGPIVEGARVTSLTPGVGGGFVLETTLGRLDAGSVILCTGAYQRPYRPPGAETLPAHLLQIDVEGYRNPGDLPGGPVLVIGSGQSGCQIAEELREAGRDVFLACGRAPWAPRRLGHLDIFAWLLETGELDTPLSGLPDPADRILGNVQATGHGGGHDLHYRTLRATGVTLLGHFLGAAGKEARFAPDLGRSVAWADDRNAKFMERIRTVAAERGLPEPEISPPGPFDPAAPEELDLRGFEAVVFAGGFRPDYASWVHFPGAFDANGFPIHEGGASMAAPGLYFLGVHYLRKRKSALLIGVGEDAAVVADAITA